MREPGFELGEAGGIVFARCGALAAVPGVAHGFSTRRGESGAAFDLGSAHDSDADVLARRASFLRAAGLGEGKAAVLAQVHGCRVVRAREALDVPEADAVVWLPGDPEDAVPSVRTADCVPILLTDRDGEAFGAVHAGWRGTAAGVASRAVGALASGGIDASRLLAAIGPAIGPCCYEVGEEVADRVRASCGPRDGIVLRGDDGRSVRLDLVAANRAQLEDAGVPAGAIVAAPWCARCRADLFHSYRRDGSRAGRMMASIGRATAGNPPFR